MSLNIEEAIRCIKSVVDSLRCGYCDKLDGARLRYYCGHAACEDCVSTCASCLLCLTPPGVLHVDPLLDESLTGRVQHAKSLLNTFQDLFHVDVNKWGRLSDHLKVEKDLFPECIQAPTKYCNTKRRSSIYFENSQDSYYPGEFIQPLKTSTMSVNFVQQWLDNNDKDFKPKPQKRKPFADLNINLSSNSPIKKRADLILDKVKAVSENYNSMHELKHSKRTHFKKATPLKMIHSHLSTKSKASSKETLKTKCSVNIERFHKNEKEESGIEVDDDLIMIHDTQSEIIDKDKQAWLAVLEAAKNDHDSASILRTEQQSSLFNINGSKPLNKEYCKVPFYIKSKLYKSCQFCQTDIKEEPTINTFKPVLITIENDSFRTTIKVTNAQNQQSNAKTSSSVQTECNDDLNMVEALKQHYFTKKSQDLFNDEIAVVNPVLKMQQKMDGDEKAQSLDFVDSDSDTNNSSSLQVTAEVHRSCEQEDYKILAEVISPRSRPLKRPRGHTPTSTDSSEKENCDPNRPKKSKKKKKLNF